MKTLLISSLILFNILVVTKAFSGGREGGSAGMGGGGVSEIDQLRNQYSSLNDCEFLDFIIEKYDLAHNPPIPGTYLHSKLMILQQSCEQ